MWISDEVQRTEDGGTTLQPDPPSCPSAYDTGVVPVELEVVILRGGLLAGIARAVAEHRALAVLAVLVGEKGEG